MRRTTVLTVLLVALASLTGSAQKIYWGDSVPVGWNGKWPVKLLTVPEKTNFERTASNMDVLEFMAKAVGTASATVPRGYLLPADLDAIAEKLRIHDVKVEVLTRPIVVSGEEFVIDRIGQGRGDGYSMIKLDGGFAKSPRKEFPAGTFRVDMAQPMANAAFYLLEPQAADGFVGSGVFDAVFRGLGADRRSVVYPVYKYFKILE